jgi:hypothetical protein
VEIPTKQGSTKRLLQHGVTSASKLFIFTHNEHNGRFKIEATKFIKDALRAGKVTLLESGGSGEIQKSADNLEKQQNANRDLSSFIKEDYITVDLK